MTTSPTRPPLDCVVCGNKHWTDREVVACQTFGPAKDYTPPSTFVPATDRQVWYVREILKGDPVYAAKLSKQACSDYISDLKSGRVRQVAAASAPPAPQPATPPAPPAWPLSTPEGMVRGIRDGRYAVRPDHNTPFRFVRVWRPTHGKKKGAIILQTQHSDAYKECVVIWPSGRVSVYDKRIDPLLLLVVVDPVTASINYGRELNRCSSCGRELTDGRSIYYSIGPECEKRWADLINYVDQTQGPYVPGKTRTEA